MADTEDYFPRGGKKPVIQHFKQSSNFLGVPEKTEKKRKVKKKPEDDDGYLSDEATKGLEESFRNCASGLMYKTVKPGMLVLGRVRQVHETKIHVMLPNRVGGTVMACHISEAYNKLLQAYVNDQIAQVRDLSTMFRPGQYVAVKVLEVDSSELMLSMMPQHVNTKKTVADVHGGCILQAAVTSVEDHGYVMDIGIPDVRAFLAKKHANPEIELDTGVLCWVGVKASESGVVALTGRLDALQQAVLRTGGVGALTPGTQVHFHVDTPLDNGIEGHIFNDTTAYIQRQHVHSGRDKKPSLGQKVLGRVLYVMPTRNTPFLTLRNVFETTHPDLDMERKFKDGDIIEEAQVLRITGRSIHLKLGKGSVGTLSLRRVQVHEDLTDEEVVSKSYPIGSTHRVRILSYSLLDNLYSVSDQPSILNEKYFSLDQLTAGQLVSGSVLSADECVLVALGRLKGFVPKNHMFDSGVFVDPKKPSTSKLPKKKFRVGQEVKARVLSVDPGKESLVLTLKPSLLTPDLEVLSGYEQALIGKAYTGVVKWINEKYMMVSFFNQVCCLVPRNYVTKDEDLVMTEAYHTGQIVNCTILRVYSKDKKMFGSLTTAPFWPAKKLEISEKRRLQQNNDEPPNKKQRTDSESSETSKRNKKDKNLGKTDEDTGSKKKNKEVKDLDSETNDNDSKIKNKKVKNSDLETNDNDSKIKNKKVKNSDLETNDNYSNKKNKKVKNLYSETNDNDSKKKNKKVKNSDLETNDNDSNKNNKKVKNLDSETNELKEGDFKNKLKKKTKLTEQENEIETNSKTKKNTKLETSEESDAIETDVYDSDQYLTPADLALVELDDCNDPKELKKRIVSLLKSIKARTHRLDRIDKKVAAREAKGLGFKTKRYHDAMVKDKAIIEQRLLKLMAALKTAQDKYKTLNVEPTGYKKTKDLRNEKKELALESDSKKVDKKEKKNNKEINQKDVIEVVEKEKKDDSKKKRKLKEIKLDNLVPALEVPSAKDFWSENADTVTNNVQEEESSSSGEEQEEQPKKKRKKLTIAEKVAKVREEEARVREMERRAIESESQPRSSEQFERSLLANPNCSQLWIAYMAFHLQATEIDKARNVGRKALNTINFREEEERLNVWLALLNCEHRFGTKESQQKTLEEALQTNDTFKVHSKLLDILVDTGKHQELSSLVDLMLRKYKRISQNYIICGGACFKLDLVDKARQVMQKAVAVLEKKEHVQILVQFALMERDHGATERAEALFEQIVAVYPQRTDVCAVYADMLVKSGDADRVRQVMERMTSQQLPARKMKILYKKWIEVEEKLGDLDQVDKVRQKAMEFIEKAKF